eukprot:12888302-Prorocentrum_lima.AAC.1
MAQELNERVCTSEQPIPEQFSIIESSNATKRASELENKTADKRLSRGGDPGSEIQTSPEAKARQGTAASSSGLQ